MIAAKHVALGLCVILAGSGRAAAQGVREPLSAPWEAAAGVSWMGGSSLGSIDASLTGPTGNRVPLFSTSTDLTGVPAFNVRLARRLTRFVQVEASAWYSTPTMETRITGDAEGGANTVAAETLRHLAILGGVVVFPPR